MAWLCDCRKNNNESQGKSKMEIEKIAQKK